MHSSDHYATKVPEVTLGFWTIKIAATTLGETGGDSVTMTLNWGYLTGTAIFLSLLVVLVGCRLQRKNFIRFFIGQRSWPPPQPEQQWPILPIVLWVSATPAGRRFCFSASWQRSACGIGRSAPYRWKLSTKAEAFYWTAITFSQTLRTALGDWMADTTRLGYEGGTLAFAAGLAVLAAAYYRTSVSRVLLFWAAFILTRPLGATVGDFLDKPVNDGGLALSRPIASAVIAAFILGCLVSLPQRAGTHPGQSSAA